MSISPSVSPFPARQVNAIHAWCERRAREIGKWLKASAEDVQRQHFPTPSRDGWWKYRQMRCEIANHKAQRVL